MADIKNLYETIGERAYRLRLPFPEIPLYISNNLRFNFFEWQKNAFENFLTYQSIKNIEESQKHTHLMFNMATGTGKTLLMAATILYYYKQGYRYFLFFVNQNNIVDKTENNFIDSTHSKFLFKDKIVIDDITINISKVETFSDEPQGIEIKFTTIQKLYNDIHIERENQTTLDDLNTKDIVMLADEAHHLNTDTNNKKVTLFDDIQYDSEIKGNTSAIEIERKGWEHTVIELILKKNGQNISNKNVLLEFTATIPATESIAKKYQDKIIYKFGLKEFLQAGYTKEINLISSTLNKKERTLQAILFQWYRHKIALKNGIVNFKPVILFRSKTIEDSENDYEEFLNCVDSISSVDFEFLKDIGNRIYESKVPSLFEMGKSRTEKVLEYIKNENINYIEICNWIKLSYQERNVIITNSKTNNTKTEKTDEETDKLLNSLEDKNNNIRAIFTVNRLTEGWDVLNLFDIVRLYEGQNAGGKSKTTPEATIKEKQLIGRGVRYFPFSYNDKLRNKRKFDDDINNELRILEELYYYTYDEESRYISHLKAELKKDGYISDNKVLTTFSLKETFKDTEFFKKGLIWYNEQKDNPNRRKKNLDDISKDFFVPYKIKGLEFNEQEVVLDKNTDLQRLNLQEKGFGTIPKKFKDIEKHIFLKAINIKAKQDNSLYQFENLTKELEIDSIEELQTDKLADFDVRIIVRKNTSYDDIDNSDKLDIVIKFLDNIFSELKSNITPKIGGEFKYSNFSKVFSESKTKSIELKDLNKSIPEENEWYVLDKFAGTSEEKALIEFIKNSFGNLESKYDDIYLLRNEEVFKIYDFEKGRGFQPDFILFMKSNEKKILKNEKEVTLNYQIFIEPKGTDHLEYDKWKEDFLHQITEKYGFDNIIKAENKYFSLIGLPFFNEDSNSLFETKFDLILGE
ncbi:MAG: DEAD/DEAH box helicase family protein [Candidatus Kapabacteria bacterium]|nr:DEAD/DEAH box helicase family protein [Candidatus Kapabacteria bacterium]